MQAFEVMGSVDKNGQILLDEPLELALDSRVRVILLVTNNPENDPDFDPDDTPVEEIKASLRRAFQEAKEGKTRPISELWERIDG
jgi:phage-related baseplate assembly protein